MLQAKLAKQRAVHELPTDTFLAPREGFAETVAFAVGALPHLPTRKPRATVPEATDPELQGLKLVIRYLKYSSTAAQCKQDRLFQGDVYHL